MEKASWLRHSHTWSPVPVALQLRIHNCSSHKDLDKRLGQTGKVQTNLSLEIPYWILSQHTQLTFFKIAFTRQLTCIAWGTDVAHQHYRGTHDHGTHTQNAVMQVHVTQMHKHFMQTGFLLVGGAPTKFTLH